MVTSRIAILALGFAVTAALAVPATAASTFQLTDGTGPGGLVGNDLTGTVSFTGTPPVGPEHVYIGPLNMTITDTTTHISMQQTVFCTDIFDNYTSGGIYNLSASTLTGRIGAAKTDQINALLSHAMPLTPSDGAAIQAAIWEIENEPGTTGYDVTTNLFRASVDGDPTAFNAAVALDLANVTGGVSAAWQPSANQSVDEYVVAPGGNPNQSFGFLALTGGGNETPIPEPASLLLLGAGLIATAAVRRNRKSAS